jgi:hypothetical protein
LLYPTTVLGYTRTVSYSYNLTAKSFTLLTRRGFF